MINISGGMQEMTDSRIWSKEETLSREEFESIQLERLQKTVERVYQNVPYYREKLKEAGIEPGDIKTLGRSAGHSFHGQGRFQKELSLRAVRHLPERISSDFTHPRERPENRRS